MSASCRATIAAVAASRPALTLIVPEYPQPGQRPRQDRGYRGNPNRRATSVTFIWQVSLPTQP
jgi:hypothetical protein